MRATLLMLGMACTAAASAAPRATVELRPDVEVPGGTVLLGQVARLHSGDLELMRRLVHLPLGRGPSPGEIAVLPRQALQLWIRRQTGLTPADVELRGSPEVRVLAAARRAKGEDIERAALDAWRSAGAHATGIEDAQVRVPVRDVEVPGGSVRLHARRVAHASDRANTVVWVEVWSSGTIVRTVPVSLRVPAAGSAGSLASGVEMPPLDRGSIPAASGAATESLGVVRGDWATLRSAAGPIVLEMAVEVLQDGRAGDKVRVRQRETRTLVMARVVGPGQLELVP